MAAEAPEAPWDDASAREHVARAESLLSRLDTLADPADRTRALDAVGALAGLYGDCLARVMRHAEASADSGLAAALVSDELIGHLLLVHGLHPVPAAERVRRAVEEAAPALRKHGGEAEVLAVEEPVVRVRVRTDGTGCGSTGAKLERVVDDAIRRAAPEIERVEAERDTAPAPAPLIPVDALFTAGR